MSKRSYFYFPEKMAKDEFQKRIICRCIVVVMCMMFYPECLWMLLTKQYVPALIFAGVITTVIYRMYIGGKRDWREHHG